MKRKRENQPSCMRGTDFVWDCREETLAARKRLGTEETDTLWRWPSLDDEDEEDEEEEGAKDGDCNGEYGRQCVEEMAAISLCLCCFASFVGYWKNFYIRKKSQVQWCFRVWRKKVRVTTWETPRVRRPLRSPKGCFVLPTNFEGRKIERQRPKWNLILVLG